MRRFETISPWSGAVCLGWAYWSVSPDVYWLCLSYIVITENIGISALIWFDGNKLSFFSLQGKHFIDQGTSLSWKNKQTELFLLWLRGEKAFSSLHINSLPPRYLNSYLLWSSQRIKDVTAESFKSIKKKWTNQEPGLRTSWHPITFQH